MYHYIKVFIIALMVATHSFISLADEKAGHQSQHVVIVSIDGLSATYLNDPKVRLPNLRKLMRLGAYAEGMETVFPSVTWPAHVSLVTGATPAKHGVISNSVLDRKTLDRITYIGDPTFTKDQCVRVPTLYDAAYKKGLTTAAIIWPATNGARTLNFAIPDSNRQEIHTKYTTPGLADELEKHDISIRKLGQWGWNHKVSAMRDSTYTHVARFLLKQYQPNLLLMHLITPDGFEHDYGPHCEEAYWACENADDRIGELWQALQQPALKGKATLIVVSDHGFAEYNRSIAPNVLLKNLGYITQDEQGKFLSRKAWSHASGGSAGIYILDQDNREMIRQKLVNELKQLQGVHRVLDVKDFMNYGLPNPSDNPQQPDLMLSAKPGYSFSNDYKSDKPVSAESKQRRGTHGHLPDQRFMHATFIMAGAGIKAGGKRKITSCLDVAPTAAALLGISLPSAEGRVLKELLTDSDDSLKAK